MRLLVDSNTLISAVATEGIAKTALATIIADHEGFWSRQIKTEVVRILRHKLRVPPAAISTVVEYLQANLIMAKMTGKAPKVCRDPKDNHILHAALSIKADAIVTGDQDLLVLQEHGGIRIIRMRDLLREPG